jgi:hypothetical protein
MNNSPGLVWVSRLGRTRESEQVMNSRSVNDQVRNPDQVVGGGIPAVPADQHANAGMEYGKVKSFTR